MKLKELKEILNLNHQEYDNLEILIEYDTGAEVDLTDIEIKFDDLTNKNYIVLR